MKKTLLALAVVAAAGSVNAAELMNTGNVSVTTDADFEVKLVFDPYEDDAKIEYDGAEIGFAAESVISDDWTAFLKYGLEMEYDSGDVVSTDIVAGFKFYQNHTIEFGQTSHVLDLGNNQSKDLGIDFDNSELPNVEDIIVYMYTGEAFGAGFSYDLNRIEGGKDDNFAFYLDATFGGLYLRGDAGVGSELGVDERVYGVKGTYTADVFSVGASYAATDTDGTDTLSIIDAWVGFSAGLDWYLGTQYGNQGDNSGYNVYLNTNYALNDVVGLYAEVGYAGNDIANVKDDGAGGSLGMTMSF
ncbi:porin [Vibrio ulleungensis]|uniref:Porin n=1 Tax=Vibrio ulleungensis TaxID=2807619 RepID=A0ABS2HJ99_9VIBR|nr:porin [Vibrio ulleungensis]MBM7036182.1 hypothetical protein [Vibrio ulleungensis]